ncbi:MAG TPA: HAMP domain-containing sensor histidine kinase, partial [Herpetosiphonaceae bacterium]|nr:HAMP domain-containing sensor histidine kinase [Herpetosiphonaceae bacterium]
RLQELNERKSAFLSLVAHELRTPLTGLRGFTDLLHMHRSEHDPQRERIMTLVVHQVDRLSDLVDELLNLTNIEQQRLTLNCKPIDLAQLLAGVVERFRLVYPQRVIAFDRRAVDCGCLGDPNRLDQVLSNLIENALKYSPVEHPVEVSIERENPNGGLTDYLAISVKDQGIGIAPEDQARLFGKFFRAANAEAYRSGLGLGLFISREIVRQHGGSITVESAPGQGSTFTLRLPAGQGAPAPEPKSRETEEAPLLENAQEH